MKQGAKVFVAGHRGMVGKALVRKLEQRGNVEILTASRDEL
ncbi:MAG: GDP-L-fucose synthase, partial [Verrucomicrobiales bacterium]